MSAPVNGSDDEPFVVTAVELTPLVFGSGGVTVAGLTAGGVQPV